MRKEFKQMVQISDNYIIILDETELEDLTPQDEIVIKVDNEGLKEDWVKGQYRIHREDMLQLDDDGVIFESSWGEVLEFDFDEITRIYHIKDNETIKEKKDVKEYLAILLYILTVILFISVIIRVWC